MPRGGKREGAGSKPRSGSPAPRRSIRFTDEEWEVIGKAAELYGCDKSDFIRRASLLRANEAISLGVINDNLEVKALE